MKKTDKKIDKAIIAALTDVCDIALAEVAGFQWLTHRVDYKRFPGSLLVVCVFASKAELSTAIELGKDHYLRQLIKEKLQPVIPVKNAAYQLKFDTEEACELEHGGQWSQRL
ncbi:Fis family transcriptional regulator [Oceanicoccus sagamiensis]|uniref:Fis family transcriptional regulator n=1 Tax=Oceanicoccus sagamiensis TaxID=716816 RepID=A0A1X9NAE1_9GAMM|nr:Fis family transcriptional regulator [Oceanicoccus sagamiensis]ARN75020.1 Fis family transcriptional regulator [Oceanicoccus sagamiensis]